MSEGCEGVEGTEEGEGRRVSATVCLTPPVALALLRERVDGPQVNTACDGKARRSRGWHLRQWRTYRVDGGSPRLRSTLPLTTSNTCTLEVGTTSLRNETVLRPPPAVSMALCSESKVALGK